jgi:hypothetical protein
LPLLVDLWFCQGKRDFNFNIKGPLISSLLLDCITYSEDNLPVLDLKSVYKVAKFRNYNDILLEHDVKMLLATLRSYNNK